MPDIGKLPNGGLSFFKSKPRNVEVINVCLPYTTVHWMHRATWMARRDRGIVLVGRIYQGTPGIHDTWHTLSAKIEAFGVFES